MPTDQQDSVFQTLPDHGLPIDYYDPIFYNRLQPAVKKRIAAQKVALLPVLADSFTQVGDELLDDDEFTEKWGLVVFCNYLMLGEVNNDEEWLDDNDGPLFDDDAEMEEMDGGDRSLCAVLDK